MKVMTNFVICSESLEEKSQQILWGEMLVNHTKFIKGSFTNDKFLCESHFNTQKRLERGGKVA